MSLKFGVSLPQGWNMELASIKDPVEAYEVMTRCGPDCRRSRVSRPPGSSITFIPVPRPRKK